MVLGSGTIYYVSKSGSDSNAGTLAAPWLTIQHAASSVKAGDTVEVMAGTYNESVTLSVSGSTAAGNVTFISYPAKPRLLTARESLLQRVSTRDCFNITDLSYVTISGFEIQNFTTSSANSVPCGIWVTGSGTGVAILNNRVIITSRRLPSSRQRFRYCDLWIGSCPASIDSITVANNLVYDNKTGESETVTSMET